MVSANAGQKYQELRMFPNPQDALPLPRRPNVERYRKLANELIMACRSNEPDAIAGWSEKWIRSLVKQSGIKLTGRTRHGVQRWIDQVTDFAARTLRSEDARQCRLTDTQFVIARSHGFQNWTGLIRHLNGLNAKNSRTARFEAAASAIVDGDIKTLKRLLQLEPALVRVRSAREHRATLLHYVSANGVEGYRQKTPRNIVKITEMLLQAGAEVDAEADVYGGGSTTLGLAATSVHPYRAGVQNELMQILLDYGAEIDHRTSGGNQQNAVWACLANGRGEAAAYLAERGARLTLTTAAGVGKLDVVEQYFAGSGKAKRKISEKELQSAFHFACLYGRTEVVKFLCNRASICTALTARVKLHCIPLRSVVSSK
jgi:Ankyrin repeat